MQAEEVPGKRPDDPCQRGNVERSSGGAGYAMGTAYASEDFADQHVLGRIGMPARLMGVRDCSQAAA